MLSSMEEIRFWTGIMRDHGEFILNSLSYNEQETIQTAKFYKESFSRLHERSKELLGTNDTNAIRSFAYECANLLSCFINFKRILLGKLLQCKLHSNLPPTSLNLMINEAMEFYKTLVNIQCNITVNPLCENLNLHRIWLPDAAGHAAAIARNLDPAEKMLIKEAQEFEKCFNCLAIKSEELAKMLLRTCLNDGALRLLNEEALKKIEEFTCYLDKIRKLRIECKALGVLMPLTPDHMIREENYYLHKIASYEAQIPNPLKAP